ncbi:MAG: hypothetical protein VKK04_25770, partial [Synechococcales bacterium]|nr:hypothetical protein [Synechococcales bacterium]
LLSFCLSLSVLTIGERTDLGLWQGIWGGGMVGLLQAFLLMRYRLGGVWWLGANTIAWGIAGASTIGVVGWFAPAGLTAPILRLIYGAIAGLKIGLLTGFAQWFALRHTAPKFSPCWIALNAGAWIVGLGAGWAIAGVLRQVTNLFASEVVGLVIAWGVVGLVGGIALSLLLRKTAVG